MQFFPQALMAITLAISIASVKATSPSPTTVEDNNLLDVQDLQVLVDVAKRGKSNKASCKKYFIDEGYNGE